MSFPGVAALLERLSKNEKSKMMTCLGIADRSSHTGSRDGFAKRDGASADGEASNEPNITLSEVARLLCILRDNFGARNAAQRSLNYSLTRDDLQRHISREGLWKAVADAFNDHLETCNHSFVGLINEVDPNRKPSAVRSAAKLRETFMNGRKAFAVRRSR